MRGPQQNTISQRVWQHVSYTSFALDGSPLGNQRRVVITFSEILRAIIELVRRDTSNIDEIRDGPREAQAVLNQASEEKYRVDQQVLAFMAKREAARKVEEAEGNWIQAVNRWQSLQAVLNGDMQRYAQPAIKAVVNGKLVEIEKARYWVEYGFHGDEAERFAELDELLIGLGGTGGNDLKRFCEWLCRTLINSTQIERDGNDTRIKLNIAVSLINQEFSQHDSAVIVRSLGGLTPAVDLQFTDSSEARRAMQEFQNEFRYLCNLFLRSLVHCLSPDQQKQLKYIVAGCYTFDEFIEKIKQANIPLSSVSPQQLQRYFIESRNPRSIGRTEEVVKRNTEGRGDIARSIQASRNIQPSKGGYEVWREISKGGEAIVAVDFVAQRQIQQGTNTSFRFETTVALYSFLEACTNDPHSFLNISHLAIACGPGVSMQEVLEGLDRAYYTASRIGRTFKTPELTLVLYGSRYTNENERQAVINCVVSFQSTFLRAPIRILLIAQDQELANAWELLGNQPQKQGECVQFQNAQNVTGYLLFSSSMVNKTVQYHHSNRGPLAESNIESRANRALSRAQQTAENLRQEQLQREAEAEAQAQERKQEKPTGWLGLLYMSDTERAQSADDMLELEQTQELASEISQEMSYERQVTRVANLEQAGTKNVTDDSQFQEGISAFFMPGNVLDFNACCNELQRLCREVAENQHLMYKIWFDHRLGKPHDDSEVNCYAKMAADAEVRHRKEFVARIFCITLDVNGNPQTRLKGGYDYVHRDVLAGLVANLPMYIGDTQAMHAEMELATYKASVLHAPSYHHDSTPIRVLNLPKKITWTNIPALNDRTLARIVVHATTDRFAHSDIEVVYDSPIKRAKGAVQLLTSSLYQFAPDSFELNNFDIGSFISDHILKAAIIRDYNGIIANLPNSQTYQNYVRLEGGNLAANSEINTDITRACVVFSQKRCNAATMQAAITAYRKFITFTMCVTNNAINMGALEVVLDEFLGTADMNQQLHDDRYWIERQHMLRWLLTAHLSAGAVKMANFFKFMANSITSGKGWDASLLYIMRDICIANNTGVWNAFNLDKTFDDLRKAWEYVHLSLDMAGEGESYGNSAADDQIVRIGRYAFQRVEILQHFAAAGESLLGQFARSVLTQVAANGQKNLDLLDAAWKIGSMVQRYINMLAVYVAQKDLHYIAEPSPDYSEVYFDTADRVKATLPKVAVLFGKMVNSLCKPDSTGLKVEASANLLSILISLEKILSNACKNGTIEEQLENLEGISLLQQDAEYAVSVENFLLVTKEMQLTLNYAYVNEEHKGIYAVESEVMHHIAASPTVPSHIVFRYLGGYGLQERENIAHYKALYARHHQALGDNSAVFAWFVIKTIGLHHLAIKQKQKVDGVDFHNPVEDYANLAGVIAQKQGTPEFDVFRERINISISSLGPKLSGQSFRGLAMISQLIAASSQQDLHALVEAAAQFYYRFPNVGEMVVGLYRTWLATGSAQSFVQLINNPWIYRDLCEGGRDNYVLVMALIDVSAGVERRQILRLRAICERLDEGNRLDHLISLLKRITPYNNILQPLSFDDAIDFIENIGSINENDIATEVKRRCVGEGEPNLVPVNKVGKWCTMRELIVNARDETPIVQQFVNALQSQNNVLNDGRPTIFDKEFMSTQVGVCGFVEGNVKPILADIERVLRQISQPVKASDIQEISQFLAYRMLQKVVDAEMLVKHGKEILQIVTALRQSTLDLQTLAANYDEWSFLYLDWGALYRKSSLGGNIPHEAAYSFMAGVRQLTQQFVNSSQQGVISKSRTKAEVQQDSRVMLHIANNVLGAVQLNGRPQNLAKIMQWVFQKIGKSIPQMRSNQEEHIVLSKAAIAVISFASTTGCPKIKERVWKLAVRLARIPNAKILNLVMRYATEIDVRPGEHSKFDQAKLEGAAFLEMCAIVKPDVLVRILNVFDIALNTEDAWSFVKHLYALQDGFNLALEEFCQQLELMNGRGHDTSHLALAIRISNWLFANIDESQKANLNTINLLHLLYHTDLEVIENLATFIQAGSKITAADVLDLLQCPRDQQQQKIREIHNKCYVDNRDHFNYDPELVKSKIAEIKYRSSATGVDELLLPQYYDILFRAYQYTMSLMYDNKAFFVSEGGGKWLAACELTATQLKDEVRRCKEEISKGDEGVKYDAQLRLNALSCIAMHRANKKFAYEVQLVSPLHTMHFGRNIMQQAKTGEGKTIITAFHAVWLWGFGATVDITTSNEFLAQQAIRANGFYYMIMGIPCGKYAINSYTSGRDDYIENGINHGIAGSYQLLEAKLETDDIKLPNNRVAVVDEGDAILTPTPPVDFKTAMVVDKDDANIEFWMLAMEVALAFIRQKEEEVGAGQVLVTDEQTLLFLKKLDEKIKAIGENSTNPDVSNHIVSRYLEIKGAKLDNNLPETEKFLLGAIMGLGMAAKEGEKYIPTLTAKRRIIGGQEFYETVRTAAPVDENGQPQPQLVLSNWVQQFIHMVRRQLEPNADIPYNIEPRTKTLVKRTHKNFSDKYNNSLAKTPVKIVCFTGTACTGPAVAELLQYHSIHITTLPPHKASRLEQRKVFVADRDAAHAYVRGEVQTHNNATLVVCETINATEKLYDFVREEDLGPGRKLQKCTGNEQGDGQPIHKAIEKAGKVGRVTVASPIAGRGADIITADEDPTDVTPGDKGLTVYMVTTKVTDATILQGIGRAARNGKKGQAVIVVICSEVIQSFKELIFDGTSKSLYNAISKCDLSVYEKAWLRQYSDRPGLTDRQRRHNLSTLTKRVQSLNPKPDVVVTENDFQAIQQQKQRTAEIDDARERRELGHVLAETSQIAEPKQRLFAIQARVPGMAEHYKAWLPYIERKNIRQFIKELLVLYDQITFANNGQAYATTEQLKDTAQDCANDLRDSWQYKVAKDDIGACIQGGRLRAAKDAIELYKQHLQTQEQYINDLWNVVNTTNTVMTALRRASVQNQGSAQPQPQSSAQQQPVTLDFAALRGIKDQLGPVLKSIVELLKQEETKFGRTLREEYRAQVTALYDQVQRLHDTIERFIVMDNTVNAAKGGNLKARMESSAYNYEEKLQQSREEIRRVRVDVSRPLASMVRDDQRLMNTLLDDQASISQIEVYFTAEAAEAERDRTIYNAVHEISNSQRAVLSNIKTVRQFAHALLTPYFTAKLQLAADDNVLQQHVESCIAILFSGGNERQIAPSYSRLKASVKEEERLKAFLQYLQNYAANQESVANSTHTFVWENFERQRDSQGRHAEVFVKLFGGKLLTSHEMQMVFDSVTLAELKMARQHIIGKPDRLKINRICQQIVLYQDFEKVSKASNGDINAYNKIIDAMWDQVRYTILENEQVKRIKRMPMDVVRHEGSQEIILQKNKMNANGESYRKAMAVFHEEMEKVTTALRSGAQEVSETEALHFKQQVIVIRTEMKSALSQANSQLVAVKKEDGLKASLFEWEGIEGNLDIEAIISQLVWVAPLQRFRQDLNRETLNSIVAYSRFFKAVRESIGLMPYGIAALGVYAYRGIMEKWSEPGPAPRKFWESAWEWLLGENASRIAQLIDEKRKEVAYYHSLISSDFLVSNEVLYQQWQSKLWQLGENATIAQIENAWGEFINTLLYYESRPSYHAERELPVAWESVQREVDQGKLIVWNKARESFLKKFVVSRIQTANPSNNPVKTIMRGLKAAVQARVARNERPNLFALNNEEWVRIITSIQTNINEARSSTTPEVNLIGEWEEQERQLQAGYGIAFYESKRSEFIKALIPRGLSQDEKNSEVAKVQAVISRLQQEILDLEARSGRDIVFEHLPALTALTNDISRDIELDLTPQLMQSMTLQIHQVSGICTKLFRVLEIGDWYGIQVSREGYKEQLEALVKSNQQLLQDLNQKTTKSAEDWGHIVGQYRDLQAKVMRELTNLHNKGKEVNLLSINFDFVPGGSVMKQLTEEPQPGAAPQLAQPEREDQEEELEDQQQDQGRSAAPPPAADKSQSALLKFWGEILISFLDKGTVSKEVPALGRVFVDYVQSMKDGTIEAVVTFLNAIPLINLQLNSATMKASIESGTDPNVIASNIVDAALQNIEAQLAEFKDNLDSTIQEIPATQRLSHEDEILAVLEVFMGEKSRREVKGWLKEVVLDIINPPMKQTQQELARRDFRPFSIVYRFIPTLLLWLLQAADSIVGYVQSKTEIPEDLLKTWEIVSAGLKVWPLVADLALLEKREDDITVHDVLHILDKYLVKQPDLINLGIKILQHYLGIEPQEKLTLDKSVPKLLQYCFKFLNSNYGNLSVKEFLNKGPEWLPKLLTKVMPQNVFEEVWCQLVGMLSGNKASDISVRHPLEQLRARILPHLNNLGQLSGMWDQVDKEAVIPLSIALSFDGTERLFGVIREGERLSDILDVVPPILQQPAKFITEVVSLAQGIDKENLNVAPLSKHLCGGLVPLTTMSYVTQPQMHQFLHGMAHPDLTTKEDTRDWPALLYVLPLALLGLGQSQPLARQLAVSHDKLLHFVMPSAWKNTVSLEKIYSALVKIDISDLTAKLIGKILNTGETAAVVIEKLARVALFASQVVNNPLLKKVYDLKETTEKQLVVFKKALLQDIKKEYVYELHNIQEATRRRLKKRAETLEDSEVQYNQKLRKNLLDNRRSEESWLNPSIKANLHLRVLSDDEVCKENAELEAYRESLYSKLIAENNDKKLRNQVAKTDLEIELEVSNELLRLRLQKEGFAADDLKPPNYGYYVDEVVKLLQQVTSVLGDDLIPSEARTEAYKALKEKTDVEIEIVAKFINDRKFTNYLGEIVRVIMQLQQDGGQTKYLKEVLELIHNTIESAINPLTPAEIKTLFSVEKADLEFLLQGIPKIMKYITPCTVRNVTDILQRLASVSEYPDNTSLKEVISGVFGVQVIPPLMQLDISTMPDEWTMGQFRKALKVLDIFNEGNLLDLKTFFTVDVPAALKKRAQRLQDEPLESEEVAFLGLIAGAVFPAIINVIQAKPAGEAVTSTAVAVNTTPTSTITNTLVQPTAQPSTDITSSSPDIEGGEKKGMGLAELLDLLKCVFDYKVIDLIQVVHPRLESPASQSIEIQKRVGEYSVSIVQNLVISMFNVTIDTQNTVPELHPLRKPQLHRSIGSHSAYMQKIRNQDRTAGPAIHRNLLEGTPIPQMGPIIEEVVEEEVKQEKVRLPIASSLPYYIHIGGTAISIVLSGIGAGMVAEAMLFSFPVWQIVGVNVAVGLVTDIAVVGVTQQDKVAPYVLTTSVGTVARGGFMYFLMSCSALHNLTALEMGIVIGISQAVITGLISAFVEMQLDVTTDSVGKAK